ncbi:MAG: hypothetical protein GWN07_11050, partial [Actinobacteria bacterium]|nr:hypothetical protein [Actinomycetota bacterium]NIU66026.1 hypothetical protein [Actinomycetota bacterium]NIW27834.1 hypothetical protein [Actinomycetota bacterium]NIX20335.1 hypothetical protein [Actinomycetota bacterium]
PNVSDFFGGPFLSPTAFGVEPPSSDAFANAAFSFGVEVALPLGEPLLAVLEHRPDVDAMTTTVYR